MKNTDKFDNLLRDAFNNHKPQPSPALKAAFLSKAGNLATGKTNKTIYIVASIALLLVVTVVSSWYFFPQISKEEKSTITTQTLPVTQDTSISTKTEEPSQIVQAPVNDLFAEENILKPLLTQNTTDERNPEVLSSEQLGFLDETTKTVALKSEAESVSLNEENTGIASGDASEHPELEVTENKNIILAPTDNSDLPASVKPSLNKNSSNTSLGVFYRPELIYNIIENEKLIHNTGIEVQYRFFGGRYVARTGLGLSISRGYYEYAAEYHEYLGTYKSLDSISFALAENNFHLIPTYYHSEQQVFDADTMIFQQKVYKQHIYLQLPFEFGYDFLKTEDHSLGIRLGPTLSVLANDKAVNFVYDPGKDQLIQINQITPERILTNWHFSAGLNYSRNFGRFVVEIEPRAAWYFNSVYEKPGNTARPYSFSLRVAFGIL